MKDKNIISADSWEKVLKIKNHKIKEPVGIIGAGEPSEIDYLHAYNIGKLMANMNFTIICGGHGGVMEAACKGVFEENGTSIGLLPEAHINSANKYTSIPVATGIGHSRNAIIACSSAFLVSVGGSYGTLSEIAYGLRYDKKVFSINCEYDLKANTKFTSYDELISLIYKTVVNKTL